MEEGRSRGERERQRTPFQLFHFLAAVYLLLLLRGEGDRESERVGERQRVHYFCNEDHLGNDFFGLINELPTFLAVRGGVAARTIGRPAGQRRRRRKGGTPREFSQKKAASTYSLQGASSLIDIN